MVIKMYRNTNLKVNIFESDKSSIVNVVLKFRYDLGNGYQITAKNVTSESETQNVFTLPEGLDIEFSYIVDGIDSDIQILKLSGAEEILVSYE